MPFGPKRTAGISGHYSEAWAIAPQLGAEACGSRWKHAQDAQDSESELGVSGSQWKLWKLSGSGGRHVGDREGVGRGAGGPEEVRKAMEKCRRGGKAQEVTVHYSTSLLRLSP